MRAKQRWIRLTAPLFFSAVPARAHHMIDGDVPNTFLEGLLSGLGHPVIGIDHLLAVISVGLVSATPGAAAVPVGFVAGTLGGATLFAELFGASAVETAISLSLVVLGAIALFGRPGHVPTLLSVALVAGVFHGYAYGESIIGAERAPLGAYLLGFSLVQVGIAATTRFVARRAIEHVHSSSQWVGRLPGSVIAGFGVLRLTLGG